jgi:tetratricopeptide (TPR) repeat protein
MEPIEIKTLHRETTDLLHEGQLCEALTHLLHATRHAQQADLCDRVTDRLVAYNYLLSQVRSGAADPMRDEMYDKIWTEAAHINDVWADRMLQQADEATAYYTQRRRLKAMVPADASESVVGYLQQQMLALSGQVDNAAAAPDETAKAVEELADECFNALWTDFTDGATDAMAGIQLVLLPTLSVSLRCLMLTGCTLSVLQWFDEAKTLMLVDRIEDEGEAEEVRQRAWVGLALILMLHGRRMEHYPKLKLRLERLRRSHSREAGGRHPMTSIQMQIYQAFEADRARRCLEEKISPELQRLFRLKLQHADEAMLRPEWEESLRESSLHQYIQELNDLRREGADVMLNVFTALIHTPFFRRTSNWLRPYDRRNPEVTQRCARHKGLEVMATLFDRLPQLCNTDKYAFFIGFSTLPPQQSRMLQDALQEQVEAHEQLYQNPPLTHLRSEQIARCYLHDLYRFYTLHPQHEQWANPFAGEIHLSRIGLLRDWFGPGTQQALAAYLFGKRRYNDAFVLYRPLAEAADAPKELLQRYAYCAYVKEPSDPQRTERVLMECNRLYPGDDWTLRFLAHYYIKRQSYAEATALLDEALIHNPGHFDLLIEMAQCLLQNKAYDEALTYLYQAEVMGDKEQDATRVIAWCHVLRRDWTKAESYAQRMMEVGNEPIDWVNAGLVALAQGDTATAVVRFAGSFRTKKPWSASDYSAYFRQIEADLLAHGYDQHLLTYARDAALMTQTFRK